LLACDLDLPVPNAFRPSSAIAENQTFKPVFGPVVPLAFLLQIYNRWGNIVFETTDYQLGWDGKYKGQDAPAGTYVWIIRYKTEGIPTPIEQTKKGTVNLIR
jgi:gliding motility-associated-like protein